MLHAWIACFEVEKALYELEYEINNRPGWVRIPLGGILDILTRPA
jgi:maltose alpha-D-glucosyltransferase/alpha-amylase